MRQKGMDRLNEVLGCYSIVVECITTLLTSISLLNASRVL
jgi:hypothetical protein